MDLTKQPNPIYVILIGWASDSLTARAYNVLKNIVDTDVSLLQIAELDRQKLESLKIRNCGKITVLELAKFFEESTSRLIAIKGGDKEIEKYRAAQIVKQDVYAAILNARRGGGVTYAAKDIFRLMRQVKLEDLPI